MRAKPLYWAHDCKGVAMETVRIGSVGLGRLGLRHAENIAHAVQNARLEAICDVNEAALRETGERLGAAKRYTSYEALLADPDIDGRRKARFL